MSGQRLVSVIATMLGLALPSAAGVITFSDNPIQFTPPTVINGGPANVNATNPVRTPLPDGYEISALSYTVTRTGAGPVEVAWESSRAFHHEDAEDVTVRISGNTEVKVTAGVVTLLVQGTIDGLIVVDFISDEIRPPGMPVNWDTSAVERGLSAGDHVLDLHSGIRWDGGGAGDTVTVTSLYAVRIQPVPEPATMPVAGALLLAAAALCRRRLKEYSLRGRAPK